MSLSINNNSSSLVALESLNAAQAELSKTENTVSTGKKVDNAADNPAVYAIAAQMNGNLQGMGAVSDSLSLGAQVVATANTAGKKIMDSLQTLQGTLTTAGQTGTDASAMATQILSTLDSVNSYARNATFSGVNLLTSGSDAINAYNGTTLSTLVNVQGQTQTFTTMAGTNTTLVDALGLTSDSASHSSAAQSTQHIFTSLNKDNVAELKTENLTSNDIQLLGNGTTTGSTLTISGKTFEFVQSGAKVSTATNIAVSLDSGFSIKNALSALVSSMNGAGVHSSLNSDNSIAVYTGGSAPLKDVTGTLVGSTTSQAFSLTGTTFAVGDGSDGASQKGDTFTIGDTKYELVKDASKLTDGKTKNGSVGIVVGTPSSATDVAKALADAGITGLTANGSTLTYTITGSKADTLTVDGGDQASSNAAVAPSGEPSTTSVGSTTSQAFSLTGTTFAVGDGTDGSKKTGDTFTIGDTKYELVTDSTNLTGGKTTNGNVGIVVGTPKGATDVAKALADAGITGLTANGSTLTYTITGSTADTLTVDKGDQASSNAAVASSGEPSTKGFITADNGTAADQIAVGIKGGVTTAVYSLQSAITNMSSVMQNLGNYSNTLTGMTTYTKSLTDAVTNGVSALTDADMAAASAKLTSLQTKQSLAIKSLTIANGQSQNILSLFQG